MSFLESIRNRFKKPTIDVGEFADRAAAKFLALQRSRGPLSMAEIELEADNILDGFSTVKDGATNLKEAFTQADIELALDDRGWLVGGKRMMGELDPLSRQVQVNRSRYYWLRDPLAKQAIRLWTDYALGDTALTWQCEDKSYETKINQFMRTRTNRRYTSREGMRRLSNRLLVDGELFFGVFDDGVIRTFDCLQMDILSDADDEDKIIAYKRVVTPPTTTQGQNKLLYYKPWDLDDDSTTFDAGVLQATGYNLAPTPSQTPGPKPYVQKCRMYHLAFDAIERRGNGLLTCCSDWSREHRRFMAARVAIIQSLSKFAWAGQVKGGQNQVNALRASLESTFAQSGLSGGTEHQPAHAPGSTFVSNEGVKLTPMPRATGAGDGKTDADQLKLMVSAGTGIFLHYFGDPSTGNLATATAMELPMLKQFKSYQEFWKDAWRDIFSIVLDEAPDEEPVPIIISMPAIIEDDLAPLAQFLTAVTQVFPEAAVPALLKQCLESANIADLDDVMDDIADNKEQMDKDAASQMKQQQAHGLAMAKASKPAPGQQGQTTNDPSDNGTLNPDTPGASSEATRIQALVAAVNDLNEVLR